MIACNCGHTMYRDGNGDYQCPRCAKQDNICPGCEGTGYRLRGRIMTTCTYCAGTGEKQKVGRVQSTCIEDPTSLNRASMYYWNVRL